VRIAESYAFITHFLRSHSIPFYPGANAAFFIWCNLKAYLLWRMEKDAKNEVVDSAERALEVADEAIMEKLLAKKVFIASGADFGSEEPGWFRIVFTHPRVYLEEGLKRMIDALS
jgi:1-aminocyclopropane-1-carboxylate synthase